jgi:hypothetical protein
VESYGAAGINLIIGGGGTDATLSTRCPALLYLMWPLQFFVNQRVKIAPELKTLDAYKTCTAEITLRVCQALYEDIDLIDAFIEANPGDFSADMLAIVASWNSILKFF